MKNGGKTSRVFLDTPGCKALDVDQLEISGASSVCRHVVSGLQSFNVAATFRSVSLVQQPRNVIGRITNVFLQSTEHMINHAQSQVSGGPMKRLETLKSQAQMEAHQDQTNKLSTFESSVLMLF